MSSSSSSSCALSPSLRTQLFKPFPNRFYPHRKPQLPCVPPFDFEMNNYELIWAPLCIWRKQMWDEQEGIRFERNCGFRSFGYGFVLGNRTCSRSVFFFRLFCFADFTSAYTNGTWVKLNSCIGVERLPFKPEGYNFWTWRGHRIHYVVQGEGFPVVLIHGFGASAFHWRLVLWTPTFSYSIKSYVSSNDTMHRLVMSLIHLIHHQYSCVCVN